MLPLRLVFFGVLLFISTIVFDYGIAEGEGEDGGKEKQSQSNVHPGPSSKEISKEIEDCKKNKKSDGEKTKKENEEEEAECKEAEEERNKPDKTGWGEWKRKWMHKRVMRRRSKVVRPNRHGSNGGQGGGGGGWKQGGKD